MGQWGEQHTGASQRSQRWTRGSLTMTNQQRWHWTTLFMMEGESRNTASMSGLGGRGDHRELKGVGVLLFWFLVMTKAQ
jgi:hypothetical protein